MELETKKETNIFKIVILGDANCGKSSLINMFINKKFKFSYDLTIGVDFGCIDLIINDDKIRLQIWDTAGHERFRSITKSYYKSASGIILCYDVSSEDSFKNLERWLKDINECCEGDVPIILVGNKIDLKKTITTET